MTKDDQTILESASWTNKDNANYYENVPVEVLQQFAVIGGFDNGCDIDLIYNDYIKNSSHVIEVGAGYGRVVQCLLTREYKGKITAIERSKNLYNFMRSNFPSTVEIINCSVNDFSCENSADVVLWMWSNISEWPRHEQIKILKHLTHFCKQGGFLILDTISHLITPLNVTTYNTHSYVLKTEYGVAHGYTPSLEEVNIYAEEIGAVSVRNIPYITTTGRSRFIHILGF